MNGNLAAQELLYNKYRKIIRDYIAAKHRFSYDNEDDVSEILIKVFLGLNKYDYKKSRFKSWVINITKNYMIDKWRNNSVYTLNTSPETDYENSYYTTNTIPMENCEFENCNSINFISTQLSASDFTLLDMKYVQGYDYAEIGKEFNVSSSTISNKVNYIKTKLKKNYSEIYD